MTEWNFQNSINLRTHTLSLSLSLSLFLSFFLSSLSPSLQIEKLPLLFSAWFRYCQYPSCRNAHAHPNPTANSKPNLTLKNWPWLSWDPTQTSTLLLLLSGGKKPEPKVDWLSTSTSDVKARSDAKKVIVKEAKRQTKVGLWNNNYFFPPFFSTSIIINTNHYFRHTAQV